MNKAILMGRLTKDPELKTTPSQIPVCSFSIAIDRRVKEGANKQTDFINCVAWRGTAEFLAKYFKKGQRVLVTGSIQTRSWEKDGVKREATEVQVDEVEFVETKESAPRPGPTIEVQNYEEEKPRHIPAAESDCSLPFDL